MVGGKLKKGKKKGGKLHKNRGKRLKKCIFLGCKVQKFSNANNKLGYPVIYLPKLN